MTVSCAFRLNSHLPLQRRIRMRPVDCLPSRPIAACKNCLPSQPERIAVGRRQFADYPGDVLCYMFPNAVLRLIRMPEPQTDGQQGGFVVQVHVGMGFQSVSEYSSVVSAPLLSFPCINRKS